MGVRLWKIRRALRKDKQRFADFTSLPTWGFHVHNRIGAEDPIHDGRLEHLVNLPVDSHDDLMFVDCV